MAIDFPRSAVEAELDKQAVAAGVPAEWMKAILAAEHPGKGDILSTQSSNRGTLGVMQVLPSTVEGLKKTGYLPTNWKYDENDLGTQVQAGVAAVKDMLRMQRRPGDVFELTALYNGGRAQQNAYLNQQPLAAETVKYHKNVSDALTKQKVTMETPVDTQQPPVQSQGALGSSSTSQSETVKSRVFDPKLLSDTMASGFTFLRNVIPDAQKAIEVASANRIEAETAMAQAIVELGRKKGEQTAAETAVDTAEAVRRNRIVNTFSLNDADIDSAMTLAKNKVLDNRGKLDAIGSDIDQRQAVGFFDNPLMYLVNQTRLPGLVGEYNAIARDTNRANETVDALTGLATKATTIGSGAEADLIAQKGLAKAAVEAGDAQKALRAQQIANEGGATRDANAKLHFSKAEFDTNLSLLKLTEEVTSARSSEGEKISEAAAKKEAAKIQLDEVNRWLKSVGSSTVHTPESFAKMPASERERLIVSAGSRRFGSSFAEGLATMDRYGSSLYQLASSGSAGLADWMQQAIRASDALTTKAEAVAKAKNMPLSGKKYFEQQIMDREQVQKNLESEAYDMRKASKYNPARIDYVAMSQDPDFKDDAVAQWIATYGPKGPKKLFDTVDEQQLLREFVNRAAFDGNAEAAGKAISDFYKKAVVKQHDITQYSLFNIEMPRNAYTAVLENESDNTWFAMHKGGPASVNLANSAAVTDYVMRQLGTRAHLRVQEQRALNSGGRVNPGIYQR